MQSMPSPISAEEAAIAIANLVSDPEHPLAPAEVMGHVLIVLAADGPRISTSHLNDAQQLALAANFVAALASDQLRYSEPEGMS